jgi:acyl-CoA synthetase (AMP-forming)/AMP-acid ligase II
MHALLVDEDLREVPPGEAGELLLTGPQLSLGYLRDPERTAAAFVVPPGRRATYYRTGDRARWAPGGPLVYLGRADNQIKIQGYRVELGEVEAAARAESGADAVAAIGWPSTPSGADGIVVFVGDPRCDAAGVRERLIARLPPYMQPSEVRVLHELPLNANGKFDRRALRALLETT